MELPNHILYASSELASSGPIFQQLEANGIRVFKARDLGSAMYQLNSAPVELAVVQDSFSEVGGMGLAQRIREHGTFEKAITAVVMTQGKREISKQELSLQMELGGIENLSMPFLPFQLFPFCKRAMIWRNQELALHEVKVKMVDFYRRSGNTQKASEVLRKKLVGLGPKGPKLLVELYRESESYSEGLNLVTELMSQNEGRADIQLLNSKGFFLMKLGKYKEAEECFTEADQFAPESITRLKHLAQVYLERHSPDSAIKVMRRLIKATPDQPELKLQLLDSLETKGYVEQAIKLCRETTLPGEIIRHYNNKGVLFSKQGNFQMAIANYQTALSFFPKHKENHRIYFNLALAQLQRKGDGYRKEAQQCIEEALKLNPDFDKAKALLAKMSPQIKTNSEQE